MQWKDDYRKKLVDIDTAVSHIASGNDVDRGAVRLRAAGLHVALSHHGRQGGGRARVLSAHAEALRVLHAARDEGTFRACLVVPRSRLPRSLEGRDRHRHLRAEHAPSRGCRQDGRPSARYLLRDLHSSRRPRLRLTFLGHHLREGRPGGGNNSHPGGESEAAAYFRRHAGSRFRRRLFRRAGHRGPHPALSLAVARSIFPSAGTSRSWSKTAARFSSASGASPTRLPWRCGRSTTWACTPR